ncbi:MAG: cobyrinate a,c-diamide synthase [Lachnospiraceae bacterium]|nr:cobyrinate a,c-diamide synthase [Lachnospiraceae bacterium]
MRRFMIAGTSGGSGKTTITCAILQALVNRGMKAASFKCGPDYIDPMFHSRIIGARSRNLDGYFMDRDTLCRLLDKNSREADVAVIEGVMGYYDGLGMENTASSYALARDTGTPVILVVPCRGMSRSVQALIDGFCLFEKDSNIRGVIFNQLAPALYPAMQEYCRSRNIRALGYFPRVEEAGLESRHLGLVTADEIADIKERLQLLARTAEKYLDIDAVLELAEASLDLSAREYQAIYNKEEKVPGAGVRIAVARDRAFCFYYEDNLELLRELGCELAEFSPLEDRALPPDIDGLILGGGYPELYGSTLEKNEAMRRCVKERILGGLPTHAECGGFMYLHREITAPDGTRSRMAGVLDASCAFTQRLQHFGYVELEALKDNLLCKKGMRIRAHEFHRCVSDIAADTFLTRKNGKEWTSFVSTDTLLAGFPHIHYYTSLQLALSFVQKCAAYRKAKEKA